MGLPLQESSALDLMNGYVAIGLGEKVKDHRPLDLTVPAPKRNPCGAPNPRRLVARTQADAVLEDTPSILRCWLLRKSNLTFR